ncbi:MAG: cytochrome c maturation protein CcmE [Acidobacteria bacterium]|nr:cytochrome c maturation protein CcmE [Acidobacteriota bacterium]
MRSRRFRVGLTAVVMTLAFGGLLWGTLAEGTEYYMHVDEVMAEPDAWYGKKLQVHGFVVEGSRLWKPDTLEVRFQVEHNGAVIDAEYTGLVPDTFQDGSEVVISGQLGPHGFTVAPNGVMAKCPSKYEPKPTLGSAASSNW